MLLEVSTSHPFVDGIDHTLSLNSGVCDAGDDAHHGHASVDELGVGRDTHPSQIGEDATELGVPVHLPFVHRMVGIEEEGIRHG